METKYNIDLFNLKLENDFPYVEKITSHVELLCGELRKNYIYSKPTLSRIAMVLLDMSVEVLEDHPIHCIDDLDPRESEECATDASKKMNEFFQNNSFLICLFRSWGLTCKAITVLQNPLDTFAEVKWFEWIYGSDDPDGVLVQEWFDSRVISKLEGKLNWEVGSLYLINAIEDRIALASAKSAEKAAINAAQSLASLGGVATARKWEKARALAVEIATERWKDAEEAGSDLSRYHRIGMVADNILRAIQADLVSLGLTAAPTKDLVMKWIRGVAPPGATKGGRPKKPST